MERTENRNVLLIIIDQLRADCLDLAISGRTVLPNLNAFAEDAASFRRNFSVVNPCGPSRTSMLTGQYAMNHRSVRNGAPLRRGIPNLALEARKYGYEPLLFGYSDTTGDPRHFHPNDPDIRGYERVLPGFNEIIEMRQDGQSFPWRAHLRASGYDLPPYSRFYAPAIYDPKRGPRPDDPAFYRAEDSDTAFLTDACLRELAVRQEEPWFACLTFIRPHPPLIAPEPYNRMYSGLDLPPLVRAPSMDLEAALHPFLEVDLKRDAINSFVFGYNCGLDNQDLADIDTLRSVYFGLATEVDRHIGRVIDFLQDQGLCDSTLVVVTADHGELLGDHGQWGKNTFFDAAFHTPLIIRDPFQGESGVKVDAMSESIDLPPTILDWIGGRAPAAMNGRSLREFLRGGNPPDWRDHSYSELDFGDPERPTEWQLELGLPLREANLAILRETGRTLVHFNGGLPPLLFDTSRERGELRNLAEDPAWQVELLRLTQKLLDHRMTHADHTLSDMKVTANGTINFGE